MIELPEEEEGGGSSGWLATFADLMSLLMCFFVLLLSFSEMDVNKYKQIAGSMKMAFGVQKQVKVKSIPKGTSIIAKEFSPGRPEPTVLTKIMQASVNTSEQSLDMRVRPKGNTEHPTEEYADGINGQVPIEDQIEAFKIQTAETARILRAELAPEIQMGEIEVIAGATVVTIRIREKGSFSSGSDVINGGFLPVMATLRDVLGDVEGAIAVEGHTDDVPISNARFRSNWDLSAARAVAVAHELLRDESVRSDRFMIIGYADSRPLGTNESAEGRGINRRVTIVVRHGLHDQGYSISVDDQKLIADANDWDNPAP